MCVYTVIVVFISNEIRYVHSIKSRALHIITSIYIYIFCLLLCCAQEFCLNVCVCFRRRSIPELNNMHKQTDFILIWSKFNAHLVNISKDHRVCVCAFILKLSVEPLIFFCNSENIKMKCQRYECKCEWRTLFFFVCRLQ